MDPVVVFGGEDDDNALEAFVIREGELVAVQQLEEVRLGVGRIGNFDEIVM